ncbi:MAG TPA: ABC transporter permease [Bryobacteraceae bacterium]|jgi:lipopolysaccharide transport system permease protein
MGEYFAGIWTARYFWMHLALSDLRSRWRRSFFGVLWSILQPLGTALLLAVVLSRLFHTDIRSYAPYIISGMLVWDFIMAVSTGGSLSFVQADAYIKHYRHPLAIYSLRTVLANLTVLALASVSMFIWAAIAQPSKIGASWLAALTVYPILLLIGWPFVTLLSYLGSRFRDLPNVMMLVLQACWFVSPVYFETSMFRQAGLGILVDDNPVFHLLQIVRAPLLQGQWPSGKDYGFCAAMAAIFTAFAWLVGRKAEKRVIFYL